MSETEFARSVNPVNIEDEMRQSYMDYAMSVIIGRALPDVRDGLKPVHRRVLYAMNVMGNDWNKPYKKSARIVGDVIGKYHPHGDTAVYDTIVRMAQPFSLRYTLVDGQGNFGSVDGDAPAAMRYTEVRMSRIAHELLADLDKDTVDFTPNYDGSENEPAVLPSRIPNLLVNGSSGIAVGMATNIPPHNLTEVINACVTLIDNPAIQMAELIQHIPGPDFPTAAIINGSKGIQEAYLTGRGRIYMRAHTEIETDESKGQHSIIVKEIPYQVNKARLMEKIAELVKDKKITGIRELRDESDKDGMRMVIELRRGEVPEVILNNLYQHTQMQNVFGINIVALENGQPRLLNLKDLLEAFIRHRREVVSRRTIFELRKARARAHVLEGLAIALANIDPVIAMIKASPTPAQAKQKLLEPVWQSGVVTEMLKRAGSDASRPENLGDEFGLSDDGYRLSDTQAQAILDLKLQRLTGLEQDKIIREYGELLETIADLMDILDRPERLMQVIRDELIDIRERYGDDRRTEIIEDQHELSMEDLISEEDVVVTLSHAGYAKSQPLDVYRAQRRGGRGKSATNMKDEDFIDKLFIANTHDTVLCFSSQGKVYWLKVYQFPQASRTARGKPIVNLLPLDEGERINAVLPIREFTDNQFVFMATADGTVKKCRLTDFSRPRPSGIRAIELHGDNQLIGVELTDGAHDVMLFTDAGKAVRFRESEVRPMGRTARGVRGVKLATSQRVISLIIVTNEESTVLTATENGYGKRSEISDYGVKGRGGLGVISIQTTERNGKVVGAVAVNEDDEIMLISNQGTLIRTPTSDVSVMGRNTQGVRLVNLAEDEHLAGLERIIEDSDNGGEF
ncbi:MAG: DNA gyrase subunit A [Gammaproteobacteria bacterium]|nr:DNA gyrase subunit A [Gammaproteobacteria bacterium]NIN61409.1 DNA gyrase subunit A [Gammaproteobacteria bacterium]NIO61176.1 DNA gyrase subunit A [Gammaproteobacteria bacterium]NIP48890.1 DNA gyrase subunit A [Gammaproteobacteria bacterium]NIQ09344.1 DNA gyrase subunit A [Gammaproteobacteria bacterium]